MFLQKLVLFACIIALAQAKFFRICSRCSGKESTVDAVVADPVPAPDADVPADVPAVVDEQPAVVDEQPAVVDEQPDGTIDNPIVVDDGTIDAPIIIDEQPSDIVDEQPADVPAVLPAPPSQSSSTA